MAKLTITSASPTRRWLITKCVKSTLPVRPEDRLSAMQRKQLLDQDEHHAGAQQVEHEPIESDVGRVVRKVADRNAMAARGDGNADQQQGGAVQPAIAQPDKVGECETAADHHPDEQDFAKDVHVVLLAQIRRGQVFGKMEGEHRQDGEPAERQGDDSGDLALTDLERTGLAKDGGRLSQDRRRPHGTPVGRHSPAGIRLVVSRIAAVLQTLLIVSSVLPRIGPHSRRCKRGSRRSGRLPARPQPGKRGRPQKRPCRPKMHCLSCGMCIAFRQDFYFIRVN